MSYFRTLRVSDPRFESQGLRHITVKSPALKARGDITVYIPPNIEDMENIPIVVLLHGVYGSHWSWAYGAGVHLTTARLIEEGKIQPMVLAMPSDGLWGDGSAYMPTKWANYEKWIVEDVPHAVWEVIPQTSKDSPQFIAGLSMGGFGALRLGAKYGTQYSGISGHSSITEIKYMKIFIEEDMKSWDDLLLPDYDQKVLLACMIHQRTLPPLRFDCGMDDKLIEPNRELHDMLLKINIDHVYEEFPGAHTWSYWEEHIEKSLIFFNQQL